MTNLRQSTMNIDNTGFLSRQLVVKEMNIYLNKRDKIKIMHANEDLSTNIKIIQTSY